MKASVTLFVTFMMVALMPYSFALDFSLEFKQAFLQASRTSGSDFLRDIFSISLSQEAYNGEVGRGLIRTRDHRVAGINHNDNIYNSVTTRYRLARFGREAVCGILIDGTPNCDTFGSANLEPEDSDDPFLWVAMNAYSACWVSLDMEIDCRGSRFSDPRALEAGMEYATGHSAAYFYLTELAPTGTVCAVSILGVGICALENSDVDRTDTVTCGDYECVIFQPNDNPVRSISASSYSICVTRADDSIECKYLRSMDSLRWETAITSKYRTFTVSDLESSSDGYGCGRNATETEGSNVACYGLVNTTELTSFLAPNYREFRTGYGYMCGIETDTEQLSCFDINDDTKILHSQILPGPTHMAVPSSGSDSWILIVDELTRLRFTGISFDPQKSSAAQIGTAVSSIRTGGDFFCMLLVNGRIECYGERSNAPEVSNAPLGGVVLFTALDVKDGVACGLRTDKGISCWGTEEAFINHIFSLNNNLMAVGTTRLCVVKSTNEKEVVCFNKGEFEGDPLDEQVEFTSNGTSDYKELYVSPSAVCALREDGLVECDSGLSAAMDPQNNTFSTMCLSKEYICGIKDSDGTIKCFGESTVGALLTPPSIGGYTSLSCGPSHACAVRVDDTTGHRESSCWGRDYFFSEYPGQGLELITLVNASDPEARDQFMCGYAAFPPCVTIDRAWEETPTTIANIIIAPGEYDMGNRKLQRFGSVMVRLASPSKEAGEVILKNFAFEFSDSYFSNFLRITFADTDDAITPLGKSRIDFKDNDVFLFQDCIFRDLNVLSPVISGSNDPFLIVERCSFTGIVNNGNTPDAVFSITTYSSGESGAYFAMVESEFKQCRSHSGASVVRYINEIGYNIEDEARPSLFLEHVTVEDCSSTSGAPLYLNGFGYDTAIINCTFTSNSGKDSSVIYISQHQDFASKLSFQDSSFISNSGTSRQGAIAIDGALSNAVFVDSCTFTNNTLGRDGTEGDSEGSAVYIYKCGTVFIVESTFTSNMIMDGDTPFGDGGAVSIGNSYRLFLLLNTFEGNVAAKGGALSLYEFIYDTNIYDAWLEALSGADCNFGLEEPNFETGACTFPGTVSILYNTFTGNVALKSGGALELSKMSTLIMSSNQFISNSATYNYPALITSQDLGLGGAVKLETVVEGWIEENAFVGNFALLGAGMSSLMCSTCHFNGNTFSGNSAAYPIGSASKPFESTIGGALFLIMDSDVDDANERFFQNDISVKLNGNTFSGNSAETGGALYFMGRPAPTEEGSILSGNTASIYGADRASSIFSIDVLNMEYFLENSSIPLNTAFEVPIRAEAIDYYNQTIVHFEESIRVKGPADLNFVSSQEDAVNGVVVFNDLRVSVDPYIHRQPFPLFLEYMDDSLYKTPASPAVYESETINVTVSICELGQLYNELGQICVDCPAGQFKSDINAKDCAICEAGSYSASPGSYNCTLCQPGTFLARSSSSSCDGCVAGTFAADYGATTCEVTALGYFQSSGSSSIQEPCPLGSRTSGNQSTRCEFCGDGKYTLNVASTECKECTDAGLLCLGGLARVRRDYWPYLDSSGQLRATKCPEKYCTGSDGVLVLHPNDSSLLAQYDTETGEYSTSLCSSNRGEFNYNPLCGECEFGYTEWNRECVICDGRGNVGLIILFVGIAWIFVVAMIIIHRYRASGHVKIILYFIATIRFMLGPEYYWLGWLGVMDFNPEAVASGDSCVANFDPFEKMALQILIPVFFLALLIMTLIISYFFGHLPRRIYNRCREGERSIPGGPISPGDENTEDFDRYGNPIVRGFPWNDFVRASMAILVFSYTAVSSVVFSFLNCVTTPDGDRVFDSPAISCDSDRYKGWVVGIYILLIFPVIGFPLVVLFGLQYAKKHGYCIMDDSQRTSPKAILFHARFSFLYETYREKYYWWEAVALVRRSLLVALGILLWDYPLDAQQGFAVFNLLVMLAQASSRPFSTGEENLLENISLTVITVVSIVQTGVETFDDYKLWQKISISALVLTSLFSFVLWWFRVKIAHLMRRGKQVLRTGSFRQPKQPVEMAPLPNEAQVNSFQGGDNSPAYLNAATPVISDINMLDHSSSFNDNPLYSAEK